MQHHAIRLLLFVAESSFMHYYAMDSLVLLAGTAAVSAAHSFSRSELSAFSHGNLVLLERLLHSNFQNEPDDSQRTAFHYLLFGRHQEIEQAGKLRGQHEECIRLLATRFPSSVAVFCPIVDAFHFRNALATKILAESLSDAELAECLLEENIDGETVLHVVSKSMASGIGRFFVRMWRTSARSKERQHDEQQQVLNHLQLHQPNGLSLREIHSAMGLWDLKYLLETLAPRVSSTHINLSQWVNARNLMGETPLLHACKSGRASVIHLLQQHGAHMEIQDVASHTCSDLLLAGGFTLEAGETSIEGSSPLETSTLNALLSLDKKEKQGGWGNMGLNDPIIQRILEQLGAVATAINGVPILSMNAIDNKEFRRKFLSIRPLLLRQNSSQSMSDEKTADEQAANGILGWKAFRRWTRRGLLKRYGTLPCATGQVPYGTTYARASVQKRIQDVVRDMEMHKPGCGDGSSEKVCRQGDVSDMPFEQTFALDAPDYGFDASILQSTEMKKDVNTSSLSVIFNRDTRILLSQFFLGPHSSGAQPHFHGHAVNVVIFGAKLWFLFPPACAFFSNKTAIEFFQDKLSRKFTRVEGCDYLVAIQQRGDVLYVPEMWGHSVLNIVNTVGVAYEFVANLH